MRFDTVLRGGTLVDPAQGIHQPMDVGFAGGRVAAVRDGLGGAEALEAVDCAGLLVAPGMIDLHVHVFWGVTYLGIEADPHCTTNVAFLGFSESFFHRRDAETQSTVISSALPYHEDACYSASGTYSPFSVKI